MKNKYLQVAFEINNQLYLQITYLPSDTLFFIEQKQAIWRRLKAPVNIWVQSGLICPSHNRTELLLLNKACFINNPSTIHLWPFCTSTIGSWQLYTRYKLYTQQSHQQSFCAPETGRSCTEIYQGREKMELHTQCSDS